MASAQFRHSPTHPDRTRTLRYKPVMEILENRVVLSTFTVTSLADSGTGSLRDAITKANSNGTTDVIDFAPSVTGRITLQTALPDLSSLVTLSGPGPSVLSVSRDPNASTYFRIFSVSVGAAVSISGLTISGGRPYDDGGGILNLGDLSVTDSIIRDNRVNTLGGGIENKGTLRLVRSQVSDNHILVSGGGGGIYNDYGTVTITECVISGNTVAGQNSAGGALSNTGSGVRPYVFATAVITNSLFDGNTVFDGYGGGLQNAAFCQLTISGCTISNNSAGKAGGGLFNLGDLTANNVTIASNAAEEGGGLACQGNSIVKDSTIAGNSASLASTGGISVRGQLRLQTSVLDNPNGGNLSTPPSLLIPPLPPGQFFSLGHNLFSDNPSVTLDPTDLVNTNPLLGPLGANGGPTPTMALLPGSPAIDAGMVVSGITTDQRGIVRPQGIAPDIGAFESRGFTLSLGGGSDQSAVIGSEFASPLLITVSSAYGEPVAGGVVMFNAPTTGASATLSSETATIGQDGTAIVRATANGQIGSYNVTTQSGGADGPAFLLTNLPVPVPPAPTVLTFQRFGVHRQPTTLVIRFSEAMDAGRTENLANYQLVSAGRDGKFGTRDDRVIRLRNAQYKSATDSVWLAPSRRLPLSSTYQLTVIGSPTGGLTSTQGLYLGGEGADRPGTNYVRIFGRDALTQDRLLSPSERSAIMSYRRSLLRAAPRGHPTH